MNKKMSIIIPVYNVEKWLGECLESLINQTYSNIEIILINDGSTDNSFEICEQYAKKDQRIQVYSQANQGQAVARNYGLRKSSGDYVIFMDSDDYLCDLNILEKFNYIFENNRCDVIYTSYCRFEDNTGKIIEDLLLNTTKEEFNELTGYKLIELLISRKSYHHAPYLKICKMSFLKENQIEFKEGYFHEDFEWTAKVFSYAHYVYPYFQRWYMRRMRENSTITTKNEAIVIKKATDRIKLAYELANYFSEHGVKSDSIIMQDLARVYWGDLLILSTIKEKNLYKEISEVIHKTKEVLKYSQEKKIKVGYILINLFGGNNFISFMKQVMGR